MDDELLAGYDAARKFSNALGYDGDSYARYLAEHDQELRAKGHAPTPWPASLRSNDVD